MMVRELQVYQGEFVQVTPKLKDYVMEETITDDSLLVSAEL
jgi:hypothetical protein